MSFLFLSNVLHHTFHWLFASECHSRVFGLFWTQFCDAVTCLLVTVLDWLPLCPKSSMSEFVFSPILVFRFKGISSSFCQGLGSVRALQVLWDIFGNKGSASNWILTSPVNHTWSSWEELTLSQINTHDKTLLIFWKLKVKPHTLKSEQ